MSVVLPGMLLGTVSDYVPLRNVYVKDSIIYSSVLGSQHISPNNEISVESGCVRVPYVGAVVVAQISRVHINKADCHIIAVNGRTLKDQYKASLTSNNVLESKSIEILMYEWFRPGDFIKAKVIYAGDGKVFTLSTAGIGLGVVKTTSSNGNTIVSNGYFRGGDGPDFLEVFHVKEVRRTREKESREIHLTTSTQLFHHHNVVTHWNKKVLNS